MKILIIATTKFDVDGITNVIMNYYRNIDKHNYHFDFVLPNTPEKNILNEFYRNNSQVYIIKDRMKKPIKYILELNSILKSNQYDIAHVHGNSHTLAIELSIAKYNNILTRIPHAHNTKTKFKYIHKLLSVPFKKSYTNEFACGVDAGKWLFNNNNFEIIDNGIEVNKYRYNKEARNIKREALHLKEFHKVIGHVGELSHRKNQMFLIKLLKEMKNSKLEYKLILIGDGYLKGELEQIVESLGLNNDVRFLGKRDDISDLMSVMDVLIMPSLHEGLPLTLVEAQASDLKCFISDNITREVNITGEVDFFDLESDTADLIRNIENYFKNKINRSLGNGFNSIANSKYNIKKAVKKQESLYTKFYEKNIKSDKAHIIG